METKTNRRSFLMASGLTAAAATRVWGANDTLRIGVIGNGGRMGTLLHSADKAGPYQLVAACDVYSPHLDAVKARSNGAGASTHIEYKELLALPMDAVIIAVPDHSHVRVASDALAAGKDVYLEKPVTHSIEEGETLIKAVRSSKQILQSGMQQRSWRHFQSAVELIQGGNIGRITQVRTYWYQNYQRDWPAQPINPQLLDWKRWLGSAPDQPFSEEKYRRWRWFWNFGGGALTDLFAHWIDVVHWAMKTTEPTFAQMIGDKYFFEQWDCPDTVQCGFHYGSFDVGYEGTMISSIDDGGLEFRGTEGTIKLTRSGFEVYREGVSIKENPLLSERSYQDGTISHMQNFFECVKSRKEPNAPVEAGVAAARAGQIGNLALHHGGQVNWPLKTSDTASAKPV
jgi:predicted dehydrogenase